MGCRQHRMQQSTVSVPDASHPHARGMTYWDKTTHTMRMLAPTLYLGWCNSRTFTCLSTPQHKPYTSHHTVAPPGQPHHLNTTCNAWTWTSCTPLHLGHIKGYQHGTGHRVPALCSTRAMEQSTILIPIPQLRSAQMQEDTCETS